MLEKLSLTIVSRLKVDGVIQENIEDIYVYGIQVLISNLLGIFSALLIGIVLSSIVEVIVFLISFIITRRFTGGFHANSYIVCFSITCASVIIAIIVEKCCYIPILLCIVVGIGSILVSILLAPIENENKKLTNEIKKRGKIISIILVSSQSTLMIVLRFLDADVYKMLFVSLSYITISLIIPVLTERRDKDEKDIIQENC